MKIQFLEPHHYEAVKQIYAMGIATGNATFRTEAPAWKEWDLNHLKIGRLVALGEDGNVIGWAALTPVSGSCAYSGVGEVSVYIHPGQSGKGLGKNLLEALIIESEKQNLWTLQAGIFPENAASLRLHQACGFRVVGRRERIGKMGGTWRDVMFLERRSQIVGMD
jgi:L-amino acid N-acyltransferase YncA